MRVLLIEDYDPLRTTVAKCLREEGYAVDESANGKDGLWLVQQNEYDAVILDVMLPGVDGFSILKTIRNQRNNVFVIVTSAKANIEDRVEGLDLGADDYLPKPYSLEELCARVRSIIRRKYSEKSPIQSYGDLQIDTNKKQVTRAGILLELSAREYAILAYLAAREGHVVSRESILHHVYDFQADLASNVIDVYIKNLRKKLEINGLPRLIHTKRYQGYSFRADQK